MQYDAMNHLKQNVPTGFLHEESDNANDPAAISSKRMGFEHHLILPQDVQN